MSIKYVCVIFFICFSACGGKIYGSSQWPEFTSSKCSAITQGIINRAHPEVGKLTSSLGGCTGTLIAQSIVLTAAHCINAGKEYTFTLDDGRHFKEDRVAVHPHRDIALIALDIPPDEHLDTARLALSPPEIGQPITLVGYGLTGKDANDWGVKRSGINIIAELHETNEFSYLGHCGLCPGDSGGPSYNASGEVIGVHSTGTCDEHSTDVRVDLYSDWIWQNVSMLEIGR